MAEILFKEIHTVGKYKQLSFANCYCLISDQNLLERIYAPTSAIGVVQGAQLQATQCPNCTTFIKPNLLNVSCAMQMKIQLNILWSSVPANNPFGIQFFKASPLNFRCNRNIYEFFFARLTLHLHFLLTKFSIYSQPFHPSYGSFGTFTGSLSFKTFLTNQT